MLPRQKIDALLARFEAIDLRLTQPIDGETLVKLSRERAELAPVHEAITTLRAAETEREGLTGLLQFGHISLEDGAKLYQQYSVKIPFVDEPPEPVPQGPPPGQWRGQYGPPPAAPGQYTPPGRYPPPPRG